MGIREAAIPLFIVASLSGCASSRLSMRVVGVTCGGAAPISELQVSGRIEVRNAGNGPGSVVDPNVMNDAEVYDSAGVQVYSRPSMEIFAEDTSQPRRVVVAPGQTWTTNPLILWRIKDRADVPASGRFRIVVRAKDLAPVEMKIDLPSCTPVVPAAAATAH